MHVADVSLGILGANGIVGAGIPIATGSGLSSKIKNTDEVTLAFLEMLHLTKVLFMRLLTWQQLGNFR